ncbi:MAG: Gfo/Idh/MocA family oxidoreductase [Chloroflexota bacterium]
MEAVRCAVIGVGMMGSEHAAILARSPSAELVVACDTNPAAAAAVPPGVPLVADLERALDTPGLEAVVIATPQAHHRTAVAAALDRGLAVLCEKPIAHTLADADAIVALGSRPGARLAIGHMYRFDPRYAAIAEAVRAGDLGRPAQLTARGNVPDFEGRILAGRTTLANENGVHVFDLFQWLAGPIERVYGEASATDVLGPGLVDSIAVTVRFANGAVGMYATSWIMPSDLGYASDHVFSFQGAAGLAWIDARQPDTGIVGPAGTRFQGSVAFRDPSGVPYGLYRTELEAFLAGVRDPSRWAWPVTLAEARSALAVALAADRSMREGRPVAVAEEG